MMVVLEKVSKVFGSTIIFSRISAEFERGVVIIEGANGSGKTTLLEMIAGIRSPTYGRISICGADIRKRPQLARGFLAYTPAQPQFFEGLTLAEALRLILALRGCSLTGDSPFQDDPFGLEPLSASLLQDLSLGWRKKAFLHSSFFGCPPVLILDEPTASLDNQSREVLEDLIRRRGTSNLTLMAGHGDCLFSGQTIEKYSLCRQSTQGGSDLYRLTHRG